MELSDLLARLPAHRRAGIRAVFDALTKPAAPTPVRQAQLKLERDARRALQDDTRAQFLARCVGAGLPAPVPEFRFSDTRRWRFDFAWPAERVALEVDGAIGYGRHTRPGGWDRDQEKLNAAQAHGWRVLHCRPRALLTGATLATLTAALSVRPGA